MFSLHLNKYLYPSDVSPKILYDVFLSKPVIISKYSNSCFIIIPLHFSISDNGLSVVSNLKPSNVHLDKAI